MNQVIDMLASQWLYDVSVLSTPWVLYTVVPALFYLVFMLMVAAGPGGTSAYKTAHYALCTGFMALGMMLPGMWAGWLQDQLGYTGFFLWTCAATLPSFGAAALIRIDPAFGKKAIG